MLRAVVTPPLRIPDFVRELMLNKFDTLMELLIQGRARQRSEAVNTHLLFRNSYSAHRNRQSVFAHAPSVSALSREHERSVTGLRAQSKENLRSLH